MNPIKIEDLLEAVGGRLLSGPSTVEITGVEIDTRKIKEGYLFIPFKGERIDGHDLIRDAFEKGAVASLTEKEIDVFQGETIIKVDNTLKALQSLAKYYRSLFNIPIIAVTGSSGKTTTKDILYSILKVKYHTIRTEGNRNNHIGMPLTIFNMEKSTEAAILEMGMSGFGEISELVHIAKPDVAIITNVGTAHLEQLGSRENIFKAKSEIFETLTKEQCAIINGDDDLLNGINQSGFKVIKVGIKNERADLRCLEYHSGKDGILMKTRDHLGREETFTFRIGGLHNIYNCLTGIALGKHLKMTGREIQQGLDDFLPSDNRMDIKYIRDNVIINDSYNANPHSMKSALSVLRDYREPGVMLVAALGDMFEIGEEAEKYHREVGKFAAENDIDRLITVGEMSIYYNKGAEDSGFDQRYSLHFNSKDELQDYLDNHIKSKYVILIKGSRGMRMEEVVHHLTGKGNLNG
ncbi:MAG: UDP-N-acetylmuramoyl-tripeptide--D-alanyl-D-alanine ligase [Eubacteriaceae bacterium]|nr:UDP-N-acetylmuramoyl-tripeptide--D-alanyl-D-alanine ligase [Eubacteriaceae bacterium]